MTFKGSHLSVETRKKMSKSHRGKCLSKETRAKISKIRKGHLTSIETREKISKANTGKVSPRKGKTYEEIYGKERAKEEKKKREGCFGNEKNKGKIYEEIYGNEKALEMRIKRGRSFKGKIHTEEAKQKIGDGNRGRKKGKTFEEMYGITKAKEIKEKISKSEKGVSYDERYGAKKAEELRKSRGEYCRGKTYEEIFGKEKAISLKQNLIRAGTGRIKTEEEIRKWIKSNSIKPNKVENQLNSILQIILPNEYRLNVRADIMVLGGKIPDFVNVNGKKKVIELYGDYWHKDDDPQDRIDYFKQFGYDCLVIWESEIKKGQIAVNKILEFHNLPFQSCNIQFTFD